MTGPAAFQPSPFSASLGDWRRALDDRGSCLGRDLQRLYGGESEAWRQRYQEALSLFARRYPEDGEGRPVVISRCPGQMNIMGMHIDYGGMPSLRLAVRGHDTVTVAAARDDDRVRLHSIYRGEGGAARDFEPVRFRLSEMASAEPLSSRQDLMDYAGALCSRRERETGSTMDDGWGILPQGQLVYLDSWLRLRGNHPRGMDALLFSNVSPSGGMSSSSALVISTAFAVLGLHGLRPGRDISWEDVIDGVGTSEWIRGTRGGTADHGGMVLGRSGQLVSVGVFPARDCGSAPLPEEYVAILLDSGVPRVYDEAGKEETVLAYPVGTYLLREVLLPARLGAPGWEGLVPDFRERIEMIRDLTPENLGLTTAQLCELLAMVPERTSLSELDASARGTGGGEAYEAMHRREVGQRFPHTGPDSPILLRRRFTFGLAEQDRVAAAVDLLAAGDVATAFELVRLSHAGDRDAEVTREELAALAGASRRGDPRGRLAFVPGGYGRMTDDYDRVVTTLNDFLEGYGKDAGAVQRLGAGWGGNLGGLISRRFLDGRERSALEDVIARLGLPEVDLDRSVATPGEGACLLTSPA
ncbi:MAG: hypothetical protein OXG13_16120 [Gemmatimonadaceae bacterium]|nr:hypothetical protein [Gemmatimonadaceae bacterium]